MGGVTFFLSTLLSSEHIALAKEFVRSKEPPVCTQVPAGKGTVPRKSNGTVLQGPRNMDVSGAPQHRLFECPGMPKLCLAKHKTV